MKLLQYLDNTVNLQSRLWYWQGHILRMPLVASYLMMICKSTGVSRKSTSSAYKILQVAIYFPPTLCITHKGLYIWCLIVYWDWQLNQGRSAIASTPMFQGHDITGIILVALSKVSNIFNLSLKLFLRKVLQYHQTPSQPTWSGVPSKPIWFPTRSLEGGRGSGWNPWRWDLD